LQIDFNLNCHCNNLQIKLITCKLNLKNVPASLKLVTCQVIEVNHIHVKSKVNDQQVITSPTYDLFVKSQPYHFHAEVFSLFSYEYF